MTQRCDCRLNDEVIDCRPAWKQQCPTPRHGRIVQLKIKNEHGYALDIKVKWETGQTEQLSPFSSSIRILAPANEVPQLHKLARKRNFLVVRSPGRQQWAYFFITKQLTEVYVEIIETHTAGLYFRGAKRKDDRF
jgi:hypothetical protein